jgi:hypothetical protein
MADHYLRGGVLTGDAKLDFNFKLGYLKYLKSKWESGMDRPTGRFTGTSNNVTGERPSNLSGTNAIFSCEYSILFKVVVNRGLLFFWNFRWISCEY